MAVVRILACAGVLFLLGGAGPGLAAVPNPCVRVDPQGPIPGSWICPYDGVGAFGDNNSYDADFSRCTLADGCQDLNGDPCPTDQLCLLKSIPSGRCAVGTNSDCVWPNGAGSCTISGFGCLADADCAAGESCDLSGNDPDCACTNSAIGTCSGTGAPCVLNSDCPVLQTCSANNQTDICGGAQARCSDGDNPFGAFGTGLCIELNLAEVALTNCGGEAGQPLYGPRWQVENPGQPGTPQRAPGTSFPAKGPILDLKTRVAIQLFDPDPFGVRTIFVLGDSFFIDWGFGSKEVSGGLLDAHIVTFSYDAPSGWANEQPVDGRCIQNPGQVCVKENDCPPGDTCDPSTFVFGYERAINAPFFMWTADVDPQNPAIPDIDNDGRPDCPPLCGINQKLTSMEEETIRSLGALDQNAAVQATLNALVDGPAGEGDMVGVNAIVSLTWLPSWDQRCFIGGDPNRKKFCDGNVSLGCENDGDCGASGPCVDGRIGRCAFHADPCDPTREAPVAPNPSFPLNDCPTINEQCVYCMGRFSDTIQTRDVCVNDPGIRCTTDADCGLAGPCTPDIPPNPLALPLFHNNHGLEALDILGRIGGVNGPGYSVRVPLFLAATSGDASLEFRDHDIEAAADLKTLGAVTGGLFGVGDGFCQQEPSTSCETTINPCVKPGGANPNFCGLGGSPPGGGQCIVDDDCPYLDDCAEGTGPCIGILFRNGTILPAGGSCCDTGTDLVLPPSKPGTPDQARCVGSQQPCVLGGSCPDFGGQPDECIPALSQVTIITPGANRIPGCIGDNDPSTDEIDNPLCASPLGISDPNLLMPEIGINCQPASTANLDPRCNPGFDDGRTVAMIGGEVVPAIVSRRKVLNPSEPAPTFVWVAGGGALDLDVVGVTNADAHFKVDALQCPVVNIGPCIANICDKDQHAEPDKKRCNTDTDCITTVCCVDEEPVGNCIIGLVNGCNDADADTICDDVDNCVTVKNVAQADGDGDGLGDACDYCRNIASGGIADGHTGSANQTDDDGDGVGTECDTDFNLSGFSNVDDLLLFLDAFGLAVQASNCPQPAADCPTYDVDLTGTVINVGDLLVVISLDFLGTPTSAHGCAQDDDGVLQCPLP
ncbi:MAG: hypothetical protein V3T14_04110 [Myxococcota bacterium]